jgi:hypothetical protein
MMIQIQNQTVLTAHPPALPAFNVGQGKGVSLSVQLYLHQQLKNQPSTKFRTVKYVLTRSSEFQENRKEKIQEKRNSKTKISDQLHEKSYQTN